jgi:hypothetical protein
MCCSTGSWGNFPFCDHFREIRKTFESDTFECSGEETSARIVFPTTSLGRVPSFMRIGGVQGCLGGACCHGVSGEQQNGIRRTDIFGMTSRVRGHRGGADEQAGASGMLRKRPASDAGTGSCVKSWQPQVAAFWRGWFSSCIGGVGAPCAQQMPLLRWRTARKGICGSTAGVRGGFPPVFRFSKKRLCTFFWCARRVCAHLAPIYLHRHCGCKPHARALSCVL